MKETAVMTLSASEYCRKAEKTPIAREKMMMVIVSVVGVGWNFHGRRMDGIA